MDERPTVLVVDDDRKTVDLLRLYLERAGFAVWVAYDGQQALDLARERQPRLVVLDLMLPKVDGLDVCYALRKGGAGGPPIIMLTARSTEEDKLVGLETGADDYVVKPFSPRELVARVKAVLRRFGADLEDAAVKVGDLEIDPARHEVRLAGQPVHLTPKEMAILRVMAREPGRVFSRMSLIERAFGFDGDVLERTVDVHVANLRRKIEPTPSQPIYVLTVPGVGYKVVNPHAEQRGGGARHSAAG